MKRILGLLAILTSFSLNAQQQYSKVKIYANQAELQHLAESGVAVDHGERKGNIFFISDFSSEELQIIKTSGLDYEVLIDDVKAYYAERNAKRNYHTKNTTCANSGTNNNDPVVPVNFETDENSYAGFYTYQQMLDALDAMASQYPNLITVKSGISNFQTWEGRPIYHVKISDNPNTDESTEPKVLYTAIHHAREPMSMSQTIFYMWYLLENYAANEEVKYLVDNTEMYFVPCINPDGYIHNEANDPSGFGMHRKNKRPVGTSNPGVDLNRNYSYGWGTTGISFDPNNDTYPGGPNDGNDYSFSEPESQAIQWLVENVGFVSAFNAHTHGNLLLHPVGTTDNEYADHHDYFTDLTTHMCSLNGYLPQKSSGLYPASGDSDDYMYKADIGVGMKDTVFAMTPEIGSGFWPDPSEVVPTCQEMVFPNMVLSHMAHIYYPITENDPSQIENMNGDFNFTLTRLGRKDGAVTVSVEPLLNLENVQSPQVFDFDSRQSEDISFTFNLSPGISFGDEIKYILQVDNGTWIRKDTITKTFGGMTVQNADPGNNTNNWTGDWNTTTAEYYSPSSSFTDSPGDYSNNAFDVFEYNETIDLTNSTDAMITYYAKWEIEANYDYCQFQVSTDGGNTWEAQCGLYTNISNGNNYNGSAQPDGEPVYEGTMDWVREEISLSQYIGQQVKVRFVLESDGGLKQDGFYFDDFTIATNESTANLEEMTIFFGVYPNPASDVVRVNLSSALENSTVFMKNELGQTVAQTTISQSKEVELNTSSLSSGIYYIYISNGSSKSEVKKVVVLK